MTPQQQQVIATLKARWIEMRGLGHHDGAIGAAMIGEGHAAAAVDLAREQADREGK